MRIGSVGEVDGVVDLLACGIDAGDKHHMVGVAALDYGVVNLLDIVLRGHAHIVDISNDEAVLDSGVLELAVPEAYHLHAARYAELGAGLVGRFLEGAAESRHIAGGGELGASGGIIESDAYGVVAVIADISHCGLVAGTHTSHLLHELRGAAGGIAVDGSDDIAGLETGFHGRAAVRHLLDDKTVVDHGNTLLLGHLGVELSAGDAEDGALHSTKLLEILGDLYHYGSGDSEGVAGIISGLRVDGGVDAHKFAVHVYERAARVAGIVSSISSSLSPKGIQ